MKLTLAVIALFVVLLLASAAAAHYLFATRASYSLILGGLLASVATFLVVAWVASDTLSSVEFDG